MTTRSFLLLCAIIPVLAGCGNVLSFKLGAATIAAATQGIFTDPDVNLREKSYAAADFLAADLKQSPLRKQVLSIPHAPVMVFKPLEELDNPGITSQFGAVVPEWIGRRFSEIGYQVYLNEVAPEGSKTLYPALPKGKTCDLVLRGSYSVKAKHVDVLLRVFDDRTKALVATFDYAMPLNREIRELAKTEAQIFRVKGN